MNESILLVGLIDFYIFVLFSVLVMIDALIELLFIKLDPGSTASGITRKQTCYLMILSEKQQWQCDRPVGQ